MTRRPWTRGPSGSTLVGSPGGVALVPDAWTPADDAEEPAPGLGIGFVLMLVVIGVVLLLFAWGAVITVLDVV